MSRSLTYWSQREYWYLGGRTSKCFVALHTTTEKLQAVLLKGKMGGPYYIVTPDAEPKTS